MERGKYLGDAVYGALDGIVTTFAVVAGVVGASLGPHIILILGFANLIADGISMGAGSYLQKRSDASFRDQRRKDELDLIDSHPKEQRQDVVKIYREKGFRGPMLEKVVSVITRDKGRWADEMMVGELSLMDQGLKPVHAGVTTFVAFVIAGAIPLLSYVAAVVNPALAPRSFFLACFLTGVTLFAVGSLRSLIILKNWLQAGLEMLFVGGIAACAAYLVGFTLRGLV